MLIRTHNWESTPAKYHLHIAAPKKSEKREIRVKFVWLSVRVWLTHYHMAGILYT